MKKIVLIGGTGGLGQELCEILKEKYEIFSSGSNINIFHYELLESYLNKIDPDIIINLATVSENALLEKNYNYEKTFQVNIQGHLNLITCSLNLDKKKNNRRFIYISSVLAKSPQKGAALYSAGKRFCESLIESAVLETKGENCTYNSIRLGYFDKGLINQVPQSLLEKIIETIPCKKLGQVCEISSLIECIIENPYINKSTLTLDGGIK